MEAGHQGEGTNDRFPVRPANTTMYQPVCEFIGSATDIKKSIIIIISIGFSVQDVNGYLFGYYSIQWCLSLLLVLVSPPRLDTAVKGFYRLAVMCGTRADPH